jgi:hypothetical protein
MLTQASSVCWSFKNPENGGQPPQGRILGTIGVTHLAKLYEGISPACITTSPTCSPDFSPRQYHTQPYHDLQSPSSSAKLIHPFFLPVTLCSLSPPNQQTNLKNHQRAPSHRTIDRTSLSKRGAQLHVWCRTNSRRSGILLLLCG